MFYYSKLEQWGIERESILFFYLFKISTSPENFVMVSILVSSPSKPRIFFMFTEINI